MPETLNQELQTSLGNSYTIARELGGGGMSRVFLARDAQLGRDVVAKVLSPELAQGLSTERFEREVRLAAALQEPHIVPVLTAGITASGLPWYTMPFVQGASLGERLREGRIPLDEAVGILRDIARALAYAHGRGIVHRDIKPGNVLLSSGTAVVTDFGIAKALQVSRTYAGEGAASATVGALTDVGTSLGTPAYMAPEQAAADPNTDHRADIYAWGIIAYEMLAGRHPFADRTTPQRLMAAQFSEMPESLATAKFGVPRGLADVVMQSIAKDPDARPATAAELIRSLDAASATPSSKRIPAILAACALVVVAALAVIAFRSRSAEPRAVPLIAVLPFEHEGAAVDSSFGGGLSDAISGKLSRLSALRVIDRSSVLATRAATQTPAQWGEALGADYVLRATIRWVKSADGKSRAQVTPVLVRVSDGTAHWSPDPEVVDTSDPFTVQAEIASRVAEALDVALAPAERTKLQVASTRDTAAFGAFVRGEQLLRAGISAGIPGLTEAYRQFAKAVAIDPRFADAHAAGAQTALLLSARGAAAAYLDSARVLASRALEIDPTQALAMGVMAETMSLRGENTGAHAMIERAVAANPSNVKLLTLSAEAAADRGDTAAAWSRVQRVVRLAPRSANTLTGVVQAAYFSGHAADALDIVRRAQQLEPQRPDLYIPEAIIGSMTGDLALAKRTLANYRARGGRPTVGVLFMLSLGDADMRREAANATMELYGVSTVLDSLEFYAARAAALLPTDARRARVVADSGWAVAIRPRDPASVARNCQVCMAAQRAQLAAIRGDREASWTNFEAWVDTAAVRLSPRGTAAMNRDCFRASVYAMLDDVDAMVPFVRACLSYPSSPPVAGLGILPGMSRWMNDPRVQAVTGRRTLEVKRGG